MTPQQLRQMALDIDPAGDPLMSDSCVQPHHERAFQPGLNHVSRIGRTTRLVRKYGLPEYQQWVDAYFEDGANRPAGSQSSNYGRTPAELLSLVELLHTRLVAGDPRKAARCNYTLERVADWFLHLVFARTWWGSQGERTIMNGLGGTAQGWRVGNDDEDVQRGLDLLHEERGWLSRSSAQDGT